MPEKQGKVVFVGNIPYNITEQQLIDVFKEVGRVVSFRLLFDRETGKQKGYGFCTFEDVETASSAVRNLNNCFVGGRQIRVDFSENDKEDTNTSLNSMSTADESAIEKKISSQNRNTGQSDSSGFHTQVRQNAPFGTFQGLATGSVTDKINSAISQISKEQLIQALLELRLHIHSNPEKTKALLTANPQLTYAVFKILISLNVIDEVVLRMAIQSLKLKGVQIPMGLNFPASIRMNEPNVYPESLVQRTMGDLNYPQPFQNASNQARFSSQIQQPVQIPGVQMNTQNTAHFQGPTDNLKEQQERLLIQIMNLTPEQIMTLPEEQKNSVNQLRARLFNVRRDMDTMQ